MANKWYGKVGYAISEETIPGIWEERIIERSYYGELVRNSCKFQTSSSVNDNVDISNEISIVADPFANENFHSMRYVEFMGTNWNINSVEPKYPRLILTIGGAYNGNTPTTTN